MRKIKLALIGIGGRGKWWLDTLLKREDVEITAVCDLHQERIEDVMWMITDRYGHGVFASTDYRDVVARDDNEAVFVTTYWNDHVKIAIAAMRAGKYAASEVGPAQSIRQCWDIVRAREETGMPYMLMENCCYNREEMMILNMVKKGLFGEIVHCTAGYRHDLRGEIVPGYDRDHERAWQNEHRCADLYPTHGLGPVMTYLDINRGNRMMTLTATASKAVSFNAYAKEHGIDHNFRNGDVVTTVIRCANGETIVLTHDTASPHPYSRVGLVQGSKGIWMEDKNGIYIEGMSEPKSWTPVPEFYEKYDHPLWKMTNAASYTGGHGGMDMLVMDAYLEAVRNHTDTPIDVYDSAAMMAVGILSEESISLGSAPVAIPDFTDGKWVKREPGPKSIYSLAEVDDSLYRY